MACTCTGLKNVVASVACSVCHVLSKSAEQSQKHQISCARHQHTYLQDSCKRRCARIMQPREAHVVDKQAPLKAR